VNGESVSWKFSHNGRNTADDTMLLRAGTQTITTVSTSKTGDGQVTSCVSGTCSVSSGSGSGVGRQRVLQLNVGQTIVEHLPIQAQQGKCRWDSSRLREQAPAEIF
jgi:hypothetical protein